MILLHCIQVLFQMPKCCVCEVFMTPCIITTNNQSFAIIALTIAEKKVVILLFCYMFLVGDSCKALTR